MKKGLKIALISILCALCLFVVIAYAVWSEKTLEVFEIIKYYINQPLPIIGVSTLVVCIFAYKCFVSTKYGKKAIKNLQEEKEKMLEEIKQKEIDLKSLETRYTNKLNAYQQEIDQMKGIIIELCGYSRNVKAHELAKKLGGAENGESQDSEITEE